MILDRTHSPTKDDRKRPFLPLTNPKVRTKSADWRNVKGFGDTIGTLLSCGGSQVLTRTFTMKPLIRVILGPRIRDFNAEFDTA